MPKSAKKRSPFSPTHGRIPSTRGGSTGSDPPWKRQLLNPNRSTAAYVTELKKYALGSQDTLEKKKNSHGNNYTASEKRDDHENLTLTQQYNEDSDPPLFGYLKILTNCYGTIFKLPAYVICETSKAGHTTA